MSSGNSLAGLVRQVRSRDEEAADGELLARYARAGEEAAFTCSSGGMAGSSWGWLGGNSRVLRPTTSSRRHFSRWPARQGGSETGLHSSTGSTQSHCGNPARLAFARPARSDRALGPASH